MPKRKASANFSCGSSSKERPSCSRCMVERGLLATEQKNDTAPFEVSAENTIPAILKPEYLPVLYQVINNLDSSSFVKLAMTCRHLHGLCFNSTEIKIDVEIQTMYISEIEDDDFFDDDFEDDDDEEDSMRDCPLEWFGDAKGILLEDREILQKYPFRFSVGLLNMWVEDVDEHSITKMRSLLAEFPVETVREVYACDVVDWEGFIRFLKDYRSEAVQISTNPFENGFVCPLIPDEAATYLVQNKALLKTTMRISDDVILQAKVRELHLVNANISQETFVNLIKKLSNSSTPEYFEWTIGRQLFEFGHYDLFDVVDINYNEEIDGPLPQTRPITFCENVVASPLKD